MTEMLEGLAALLHRRPRQLEAEAVFHRFVATLARLRKARMKA